MTDLVIVSEAADGKGGASLAAIASANALAATGLRVHFFAATGPISPNLTVTRARVLGDGYDLMQAPPLKRARLSLWNTEAETAFKEFIQELSPHDTLIHFHSFSVQLTSSVVRAAWSGGYPVVLTLHDYGVACPYTGYYNYNTREPCGQVALSLKCTTTLCNESRSVPGKLWHVAKGHVQSSRGRVPAAFDHMVFPSQFSWSILGQSMSKLMPTSMVRNIIDVPKASPRELLPGAPFLFAGRMTREKGAISAAEAAASIGAPIAFVGEGPEEEEVRSINPNARLLGWLGKPGVLEAMRTARALVFPSRLYESSPSLVVEEAQAVGLPAIVSDITAAVDAVEHEVTGLHFQMRVVSSLAEQMQRLMDDDVARSMGLAAYEAFWKNPPTKEAHTEAILRVYDDVWRRRSGG